MAVGFNPSSSRLMAYQRRDPVGAAAPRGAAAYPHLFASQPVAPPAAPAGALLLDQLRQQLAAIQQQLATLLASWQVTPTPAPTPKPTPAPRPKPTPKPAPAPTPAPGSVTAGALSVEQLRTGRFAGCLFGSTTQDSLESADSTARKIGRQLDVNHSYFGFEDKVPNAEVRADVAAGRVPWISFNCSTKSGTLIKWADIASGKHDAKLREVAQGIKSLGKPVFFTFNHEPENDQERGTPAEYQAAWKRVSAILKAEGATNAVKVFVAMGWKPEDSERYYPGDSVDWIAGDPYNWAFSKNNPKAKWASFEQASAKFYNWAKTKGKPLMIGETGALDDPSQPGRQGQWIRDMGEALKRMPEIKALCYFNNKHTNDWYLDNPQSVAAFKAVAQDPYFARH